jgi:hypothetical protein
LLGTRILELLLASLQASARDSASAAPILTAASIEANGAKVIKRTNSREQLRIMCHSLEMVLATELVEISVNWPSAQ